MTPVPEWQTDASGNHYCDDDSQMQLAFACEFFAGFDLPAFDIWLYALPECGIKQEMLERRALAEAALRASNKDAAFRHLEWMLLRKSEWRREGFLLPLAKKGFRFSGNKRGESALTRLLREILEQKGMDASAAEVLADLSALASAGHDVIEHVDEEGRTVTWRSTDGGEKDVAFSTISNKLAELRKQLV